MDGRQRVEPEQGEAIAKGRPSILENLRKPEPLKDHSVVKPDKREEMSI